MKKLSLSYTKSFIMYVISVMIVHLVSTGLTTVGLYDGELSKSTVMFLGVAVLYVASFRN